MNEIRISGSTMKISLAVIIPAFLAIIAVIGTRVWAHEIMLTDITANQRNIRDRQERILDSLTRIEDKLDRIKESSLKGKP